MSGFTSKESAKREENPSFSEKRSFFTLSLNMSECLIGGY